MAETDPLKDALSPAARKRGAGLWAEIAPRPTEVYGHTSLRGLAALSVVGYHAALIAQADELAWSPVSGFLLSSFLFVDLFFMLSGFIMVEAYGPRLQAIWRAAGGGGARAGLRAVLAYWRRRALKILPNYYVWLGVAIGFSAFRAYYFNNPKLYDACFTEAIWRHVMLVQTFSDVCINFNTPLWSIVVELIAYLIFPLLIVLLPFWPVIAVAALGLYVAVFWGWATIDVLTGWPSVMRCLAGFMLGMLGARVIAVLPRPALVWGQLPVFLAVLICVSLDAQPAALAAIAVLVVLTGRNAGPLVAVLRVGLAYVMGRASFSIYLAHIPLLGALNLVLSKLEAETGLPLANDWRLFVPLAVCVSGLVGLVAYQLIERRFEAWLR